MSIDVVKRSLKTWRIFHTDHRRRMKAFAETISVVIGLYFLIPSQQIEIARLAAEQINENK